MDSQREAPTAPPGAVSASGGQPALRPPSAANGRNLSPAAERCERFVTRMGRNRESGFGERSE
jgi:hypothetical protein